MDEFIREFERTFTKQEDGTERQYPWKDGMKKWSELPASMRSMIFTQAMQDWRQRNGQAG